MPWGWGPRSDKTNCPQSQQGGRLGAKVRAQVVWLQFFILAYLSPLSLFPCLLPLPSSFPLHFLVAPWCARPGGIYSLRDGCHKTPGLWLHLTDNFLQQLPSPAQTRILILSLLVKERALGGDLGNLIWNSIPLQQAVWLWISHHIVFKS